MANYPNRDGRLANGVGLDTPESVFGALLALHGAGYDVQGLPDSGAALIAHMRAGPTNAGWQDRTCDAAMSLDAYDRIFASLPVEVRDAVTERWGAPAW
jgi:cobaltochelatase CobN